MNIWDFDDGVDTDTVMDWCARDREEFAEDFFLKNPRHRGQPAALWLEDLLDSLGIRVRDCPLAPGQLGLCDPTLGVIFINSEMGFVHHKTDLEALRASTMAHEFGHLRLHEQEDQVNVYWSSYHNATQFHHPRSYQREREADLYAALFLVPLSELKAHRVVQNLLEHRRERRTLSPLTLWKSVYRLARDFRVSPTLMKRCLFELRWIERANNKRGDRELLKLRWE